MTKAEILACLSKRHAKIVASPYTLGKSNLDAIERTIEALDSPYSFYAVLSAEERAQVRAQWQALAPQQRDARKKSRSKLRTAPELPPEVLKFFGSSECLPHRPRAANDYTQGIQRVSWKKAQGLRSVELNPPAHIYWLVFDCDHSEHERWKTAGLPEPAFITINPQNGHHHVVYRLSTPVCRSECARARPLAYLRAVEKAMRVALGGDRGYARLLTKNPLHPAWMTIRPQVMPSYSLAQLAATVDLKNTDEEPGTKKGRTSRQFAESLSTTAEGGRNRALFDAVRHRPATEKDIRSYAERCNAMLPEPLPASEVIGIAKSIERYETRGTRSKSESEAFRSQQAARGRLGGRPRTTGISQPWVGEGVSKPTWYRKKASMPVSTPAAWQQQSGKRRTGRPAVTKDTQPWLAEGKTRSTWYRHEKAAKGGDEVR